MSGTNLVSQRVGRRLLQLFVALGLWVAAARPALAQTETVLHSFASGDDGEYPQSGVVVDAQGNLYGTTSEGGDLSCDAPYGCGTVFELHPDGTGTELHSFTGGMDGDSPWAGVVFDAQGSLYGTTGHGGVYGYGTVFKLTPQ